MPRYTGLPTAIARAYQSGEPDAYGRPPERTVCDGDGAPCRHCLRPIPAGAEMLVLAHRPFETLQPYAETGPIFLCADRCAPPDGSFPEVLTLSPDYLLKGYDAEARIVYGTGRITPRDEIDGYAARLLDRVDIAFVDIRSARNNCWQVRVTT